jgi:AcrR family transcriptional regulator
MASETEHDPAASTAHGGPESPAPRQRAKRLPAAERKAVILREASLFFAKEGFAASTRDLADKLGVRQALLYKYFPSKEALLEAIFEDVLAVHWVMEWANILSDHSLSLDERLARVYIAHLENEDGVGIRLFLRAALDGWVLPKRRLNLVKDKLVTPIIADLRREAKLPGYETLPLMVGEFELAMVLHGSIIFNSMRTHIYGGDNMPADASSVVRLYVSTFLQGARANLPGLHAPDAPACFKVLFDAKKSAA